MTPREPDRRDLQQLLNDSLEHSEDACFLHRLHCVFIVRKGVSACKVAEWFNYSPSTITRWVHQFNELGADGLKDRKRSGRPKNLNSEQLKMLKENISQLPCQFGYSKAEWDGKCLQSHLEAYYGVSLGIRQCQRLLKQLRHSSNV